MSAEIGETRRRDAGWHDINRITSRILLSRSPSRKALLEELAGLYRARFDELKPGIHRCAPPNSTGRPAKWHAIAEQTPLARGETDSPFHAPIDFITVDYEEAPLAASRRCGTPQRPPRGPLATGALLTRWRRSARRG